MPGYSKEQQLAYHNKRKQAKKSSQEKGVEFEKAVQATVQKTSLKKVRRNHQGREGGGLSQPDLNLMDGWHCEAKDEVTLRMPAYHKQLLEDCPKSHKPALVYRGPQDGVPWVSIRLDDRMNFASDLIEAAGGEVSF
jgi:hypothetical protein